MREILFRGMDRRALDAVYDNRAAVRDYPAIAAAMAAQSERYRAAARVRPRGLLQALRAP